MSGPTDAWPAQWGEPPPRGVLPLWAAPGRLVRQAASVAAVGLLTGWRRLPRWAVTHFRGHVSSCGECPYRRVCGGYCARAWASSGDYLAEDLWRFIRAAAATARSVM